VLTYRDYNVRGNVDTKLRIREKDGVIKSWGHFNLENFTANLAGLQLPESYVKVKTRGSKIFSDSNITFAKNQNIKILGALDYLAPNMDLSILSDKIYFNDVIILAKAVLDTLRIKNDFDSIKGEGYFLANAEIKTNFKNLKSNGSFIVNNGKIQSDKRGLVLDRMNVSANLDNNVLSIYDSGAYINGKKLNIKGSIDEKTNTDIAVIIEKLPLPELYKVFAPSDIKKQIDLLSGDLSLNANIKGKLKNAIASMKINVTDFSLTDKAKTFIIKNDDAQVEFLNNFKSGLVTNKNLKIYIPMSNSNIEIPLTSVMLDTQNVTIPLSLLKINDKSNLLFSGEINDYLDDAEINFVASGDLDALDLRRFAGKNFEKFVDAKGKIPVELSVEGDKDKMTLKADLLPNSDNYITPIHFNKVMGADTALKTVVNIRHNRIKIKDTGLYIRKNTVDEEGQTQITFDPVITVDGTIVGDYINKLTIDVPKELDGVIYAFKSSKFKVNPSKLHVFSNLSAPKFKGKLSISDIAIPDLYLTLSKAVADFRETFMHFDVSELILNGSDMHIDGDLSLIPSSVLELSNLNINSSFTDADKIMKVSDAAMNILPPSNSTEPADIPVAIKNGGINFKSIKSGNIILDNTTSKIVMKNNIFYLDDLLTHMCDGMISGKIAMNL
ncbi:hypothetical protein IJV79_00895, partial [bacterium]|nr:hypothetical protein [bacterium]